MRLKHRLSMLFLAVIAVGSATTLFLVRRSTESMFRSFVFSGDAEKAKAYATILAEYRLEKGNWENVQGFLAEMPEMFSRMVDTRIHGESGCAPKTGYPAATLRSLMADGWWWRTLGASSSRTRRTRFWGRRIRRGTSAMARR
jgi:hypothetical protein